MAILALDVGSSSVRAILFKYNSSGVKLIPDAIIQHEYRFNTREPGQATVNPVILRELVERSIDEILRHPQAKTIEAVGMDTFAGNWMVLGFHTGFMYNMLDENSRMPRILSSLYTYADTRSAAIAEELKKGNETYGYDVTLTGKDRLQRTGTAYHSAYWPAQLLYAAKTERIFTDYTPGGPAEMVRDFATMCYCFWMNRGEKVSEIPISYSIASWNGWLDRETLNWDDETGVYKDIVLKSKNLLADYTEFQRGLTPDYAKRWLQLADVPFYLAVGDGAAAQVGSGAVAPGTATLTIGTTAAIRKVSTEKLPPVPEGCWGYRIDADHHLLGGALSEGGSIFAWARDTLKLNLDTLEDELAKREPASHGLTVLPLFAGERSPGWRGDATGTIHGIRLSTTPLDIVHALLESVALRLAIVAQQLELGDDVKIMASGGALTRSPAWAQIIADALQHPLYLLDEPEITALGTAHLAWCALNNQPVTGASPNIARIIEPRTQYAAVMWELIEKQQELYQKFYL